MTPSPQTFLHTRPKMAISSIIVIIFSVLSLSSALPSTTASENNTSVTIRLPEKNFEVVVEGVVYCQNCAQKGTWSLTDAKPVQSAKVGVICKDQTNQIKFYKVFETDSKGYFYAQLQGYRPMDGDPLLDHPLQSCKVKLVAAPPKSCHLLSDINDGVSGAPLRFENKIVVQKEYKAVIYAAGPLAFRPADC